MRCFKLGCAVGTVGVAATALVLMAGCVSSPSVNVLGAYFPGWLFCIIAGVVLAVVVHQLLARTRSGVRLGPPAVLYPTLVTFLALVVWLIFFQH